MFKIVPHIFDKILFNPYHPDYMLTTILTAIGLGIFLTMCSYSLGQPSGFSLFIKRPFFFTIVSFFIIIPLFMDNVMEHSNPTTKQTGLFSVQVVSQSENRIDDWEAQKLAHEHNADDLDKLIRTSIGYIQSQLAENNNKPVKETKLIERKDVPKDQLLKEGQRQYAQLIYIPEDKPVETYIYDIQNETNENEEPRLLERFLPSKKRKVRKGKVKIDKETIQKIADEKLHFYYNKDDNMFYFYE